MEYALLEKVGVVINLFVKGGYLVAGGYFVKTAFRYVTDYKTSVANDRGTD
jgi:hypothetical protein